MLAVRGYRARAEAAIARWLSHQLCAQMDRFRPWRPAADAIVLVTDGRGRVRSAAAAAASLLNVAAKNLVGALLLHFVARRDTGAFRDLVKTLGYGSVAREMTVRLRPRHGAVELMHLRVAPIAPNRYEWTMRRLAKAVSSRDAERVESRR